MKICIWCKKLIEFQESREYPICPYCIAKGVKHSCEITKLFLDSSDPNFDLLELEVSRKLYSYLKDIQCSSI